jgi:hypothetical protein
MQKDMRRGGKQRPPVKACPDRGTAACRSSPAIISYNQTGIISYYQTDIMCYYQTGCSSRTDRYLSIPPPGQREPMNRATSPGSIVEQQCLRMIFSFSECLNACLLPLCLLVYAYLSMLLSLCLPIYTS